MWTNSDFAHFTQIPRILSIRIRDQHAQTNKDVRMHPNKPFDHRKIMAQRGFERMTSGLSLLAHNTITPRSYYKYNTINATYQLSKS